LYFALFTFSSVVGTSTCWLMIAKKKILQDEGSDPASKNHDFFLLVHAFSSYFSISLRSFSIL